MTSSNPGSATLTACANCGNGEVSERKLKTCNPCKLVSDCQVLYQVSHWPRHKEPCKAHAAEFESFQEGSKFYVDLFLSDEELFKDHPGM